MSDTVPVLVWEVAPGVPAPDRWSVCDCPSCGFAMICRQRGAPVGICTACDLAGVSPEIATPAPISAEDGYEDDELDAMALAYLRRLESGEPLQIRANPVYKAVFGSEVKQLDRHRKRRRRSRPTAPDDGGEVMTRRIMTAKIVERRTGEMTADNESLCPELEAENAALREQNKRLRALANRADAVKAWIEPDLIPDELAAFRVALDLCKEHGDLDPLAADHPVAGERSG